MSSALSSLLAALGAALCAADAEPMADATVVVDEPAPVAEDDRAALAELGRTLPLHGLMPLAPPAPDAPDESWQRFSRSLARSFAPESMRPAALKTLLATRPLAPAIAQLVPRHRRYRALQELLVLHARRMGVQPAPLPETPYRVRVGVTAPEVGLLRDRLRAEGYGDEGVQGRLRDYFDERLKRALHAWQKDHGLPPTVVIDPLTRRRLNEPIAMPIADIALALARFRDLDLRGDEGRRIVVHINDYRLVAERDGAAELAMPVVVGKTSERDQTPAMSTRLEAIIANPTWGVPQRIVDDKLRPEARDIPEMLIDKGFEVTVEASGRWRVRMRPGPDNPLGKLKFQLANANGIYLHDTPTRAAFERDDRTLSHGCVRLSDARALARWVVPDRVLDLEEALAYSMFTTTFEVQQDVPTHLVYQTVLVEDGRLVRFPDLYDRDAALLAAIDGTSLAAAVRAVAGP